jgi:hypothetical protein
MGSADRTTRVQSVRGQIARQRDLSSGETRMLRRNAGARLQRTGACQFDAAAAFFTAHSLVTFSPSLNENVTGMDAPALTACVGFSNIT